MIARPKRSRFMGRAYSIEYAAPGSIIVDGSPAWGETDHDAQTIRVEEGLHPDRERGIVVHEILHQIFALVGSELSEVEEERVCTVLGDALFGHMRDNPALWRYLQRRPPKK